MSTVYENLADELDKRASWLADRSRVSDAILMQRAAKKFRLVAQSTVTKEALEFWLTEIEACNWRMWNGSKETYFWKIQKGVDAIRLALSASEAKAGEPVSTAAQIVQIINDLRGEEGDSVTILCENPDGPNAIECNGGWTNWKDKRFEGLTILDALAAAYIECIQMRAALDYGKKWATSAAPTPPQVDCEAVARNEDAILRLVHKHFNEKDAKVLMRTVWKDSIDVDYLNLSAKNFISDVLSLLAPTAPAQEGEH